MSVRSINSGAVALVLLTASAGRATASPICIDGSFADWAGVAAAWEDPVGDSSSAAVDFGRLWLADNERFLFLRFELGAEVDLSDGNDLRLYVDTDACSETGMPVNDLGAELEWRFGSRFGKLHVEGGATTVQHADIRFRAAPSYAAAAYEVAVGRDVLPDGLDPLIPGPVVRVALADGESGDRLPDAGTSVTHVLDTVAPPSPEAIPLTRISPDDLRIITYNVHRDAPWDPSLTDSFARALRAVDPDIINFQEVYDHSTEEVELLVEYLFPLSSPDEWFTAGNHDCKTASRYPIVEQWSLDGNLALLMDTIPALSRRLLVINAHLPCCSSHAARQAELDRIAAFIREARLPGGAIELEPGTPIVITGDLNLVGPARQLVTLTGGDIDDESTFGPDFAPDWDGSSLANLLLRQTELEMGYTWRSDSSTYWPGHLDYFSFTDTAIEATHGFVLYTPQMSPEHLTAHGLLAADSLASDHLIVCADFRAIPAQPGDYDRNGRAGLSDLAAFVACQNGPGSAPEPAPPFREQTCRDVFDATSDDDVDLSDFAAFAAGFVEGTHPPHHWKAEHRSRAASRERYAPVR